MENFKGLLQEMCQKYDSQSLPMYTEPVLISDSNNNNSFHTEVMVKYKGKTYKAEGSAKSKKEAERNAAREVYLQLKSYEESVELQKNTSSMSSGSTLFSSIPMKSSIYYASSTPSQSSNTSNDIFSVGGSFILSNNSNSNNNSNSSSNSSGLISSVNNTLPSTATTVANNNNNIISSGNTNIYRPNSYYSSPINRNPTPTVSNTTTNNTTAVTQQVSLLELNNHEEIIKLQQLLEKTIADYNERIESLETKYKELRHSMESKHTENKQYIERQLKRKSRKGDQRQSVTLIVNDRKQQNNYTSDAWSSTARRSTVSLQPLDPHKVPLTISFYRYLSVFSHGVHSEDFTHLGQQYNYNGFILYSPQIIPKPVIHIANSNGDQFAMSIIEFGRETLSREEFARIVTFHSFFYQQVLDQKTMIHDSPEHMFFLPNVVMIENPTRPLHSVLMDLITYEEPTYNQPPDVKGKELRAMYDQKFLNKVVMTQFNDFNVVRTIDYKQNFIYKDGHSIIKDSNGNKIILKSNVSPSLMVTHTSAANSKDYWKMKSLLFYNKDDQLEDPLKWQGKMFSQLPPIKWESFIRKSKNFPKDPLVLKVFGITSLMHSVAKIAILVFMPEIEFCKKMESFKKDVYSINNERLLREIFTHPSTKRSNLTPPVDMKIFKDYKFYEGDNQRIEFLGDSVLKFCATVKLFYSLPEATEGILTTKRSEMTNNSYLLEICDKFEIDEILRLPQNRDDIKKPKADVVEALFGAVYLEKGIYEAYRFIMKMIFKEDNAKFPIYKCKYDIETPLNDEQINVLFTNNIEIKHHCLFIEAMNCCSDPRLSYQRLEFLGDAFLDVVASDFLFHAFPSEQEGFLSQARALLVKNDNLANVFQQLNLRACVDLNSCPGIVFNLKRMGDLFESFIGCLLLDNGIEKTKTFIQKKLDCSVDNVRDLMKTIQPIIIPTKTNNDVDKNDFNNNNDSINDIDSNKEEDEEEEERNHNHTIDYEITDTSFTEEKNKNYTQELPLSSSEQSNESTEDEDDSDIDNDVPDAMHMGSTSICLDTTISNISSIESQSTATSSYSADFLNSTQLSDIIENQPTSILNFSHDIEIDALTQKFTDDMTINKQ